jgi:hypothetical protein
MLRLNCDILLPSLTPEKSNKRWSRLFKRWWKVNRLQWEPMSNPESMRPRFAVQWDCLPIP